jgi:hypothetical protein
VESRARQLWRCLFALTDEDEIYIALECPAIDQPTDEYLDLAGDLVTKSGIVNASQEGFAKKSGNVTFKAKIGGSTR